MTGNTDYYKKLVFSRDNGEVLLEGSRNLLDIIQIAAGNLEWKASVSSGATIENFLKNDKTPIVLGLHPKYVMIKKKPENPESRNPAFFNLTFDDEKKISAYRNSIYFHPGGPKRLSDELKDIDLYLDSLVRVAKIYDKGIVITECRRL